MNSKHLKEIAKILEIIKKDFTVVSLHWKDAGKIHLILKPRDHEWLN